MKSTSATGIIRRAIECRLITIDTVVRAMLYRRLDLGLLNACLLVKPQWATELIEGGLLGGDQIVPVMPGFPQKDSVGERLIIAEISLLGLAILMGNSKAAKILQKFTCLDEPAVRVLDYENPDENHSFVLSGEEWSKCYC